MSRLDAAEPRCVDGDSGIALHIEPVARDIGDFSVRRVLPSPGRRSVGPFVFFDHIGPADLPPGKGIQVRPHPHIGLATVTYLFEGEIMHRDSLGYVQPIAPGAINLMTAGQGIVHSERSGEDFDRQSRLHGIQSWMALPLEHEETKPSFAHYAAGQLPQVQVGDAQVRVIIGSAYGATSPVAVLSPMLYLEIRLPPGAELALPAGSGELAVYLVAGDVSVGAEAVAPATMAVLLDGARRTLTSAADSRLMVLGGAALGRRHVWWNFVSSSRARIDQAAADWQAGRFAAVPGDDEFIPLPER